MTLPFTKASACGNDFLIIEGANAPPELGPISRQLCDRHNGVGADGVEWLFPGQDADARVRLINADGSEAEISGNGTRCSVRRPPIIPIAGWNGAASRRRASRVSSC